MTSRGDNTSQHEVCTSRIDEIGLQKGIHHRAKFIQYHHVVLALFVKVLSVHEPMNGFERADQTLHFTQGLNVVRFFVDVVEFGSRNILVRFKPKFFLELSQHIPVVDDTNAQT